MATMIDQFCEALQRLASSAQEQEGFLRQLGTAPSADELALDFSDALGVVRESLGEPARDAALRLDQYLGEISGGESAELWTVAALYSAPEWVRIRELANEALRRLNGGDRFRGR